jgi:hypothetical protein
MSWKKCWVANKQGAGDTTLVEGCPYVKNGEHCEQMHPAQRISSLVGKSVWNSVEFCNKSDSGPFELWNFHQNFIFPIVKCFPTNSKHVSSSLESLPAIHSSDFMNQKTFPPSHCFARQKNI